MTERYSFLAYLATLAAIVLVCIIGGVLVAIDRDIAALGIGGVGMGLIGALGTFKPSTRGSASVVQTGDSATVNEATQ
jgi:drug/metabolite transporter (DMT)-like permease